MKKLLCAILFICVASFAWGESLQEAADTGDITVEALEALADTGSTTTSDSILIMRTCYYEFEPTVDITAYELALILRDSDANSGYGIERLPDRAKRHFRQVCY